MIPRFRPALGVSELQAAFRRAGPDDIAAFEASFAHAVGQRHAVAFPYGRTGLLVLLRALEISRRYIICPAYTCVVVPHAIVLSGNEPLFVDSGADANMDLRLAGNAIDERTGALIATSIFGHPVDLDALESISRSHPELPILQDCAHSFTAEWNVRRVNTAGKAALFGLNASKIMMSIFGGMITTDDAGLDAALRRKRAEMVAPARLGKSLRRTIYLLCLYGAFSPAFFGFTEMLRKSGLLDRFTRYYDEGLIDMPSDSLDALTPVEARVGTSQCPRLASFIAARRKYAAYYREALADEPALAWVEGAPGTSYSHVVARVTDRHHVMEAAASRGIQLGEIIEYCVPEMTAYRTRPGAQNRFPVASALSRQTINLPVSGCFDERLAAKVAFVMKQVLADQAPPRPL